MEHSCIGLYFLLKIDIGQYMEQEMKKYHHQSTEENETTKLQSDVQYHHQNMEESKTTTPHPDVQYHGHHKSKSESHFDFLSAKRK